MPKRHSTYSGLSRFAFEAFGSSSAAPSSSQADEQSSATKSNNARKLAQSEDEQATSSVLEPPTKKRRTGLLDIKHERIDATGLVPHYTEPSEVPDHLRKYFFQRERYFSLYSSGCLLDEEGWYSVTPELIANQIAERCRCGTIVDAFCGVGGNAIAFAQTCERVIAIDTSPVRLALARHNAAIYGVEDRIEFVLADYLSFARSYLSVATTSSKGRQRKIDVVFLSPPWGGPEYIAGGTETSCAPVRTSEGQDEEKTHPEFSLENIRPVHGADLFRLTRKLTPNVAYFLPRNTNLEEISALLTSESDFSSVSDEEQHTRSSSDVEIVEVEEEWMGPKLKALTCYFGGLATGQESMYDRPA